MDGKKGIYDRWIQPSEDLYDSLPDLRKKLKDNTQRNSSEFIPCDSHLNHDVNACHDHHKFLTDNLPDADKNKLDGSTPNTLSSSYKIMLHPDTGCVSSLKKII